MNVPFQTKGDSTSAIPTESDKNQRMGDGSGVAQTKPPHQPKRHEEPRSGCEGSVNDSDPKKPKGTKPKRCAC